MTVSRPLVLLGMMASGKTSIAKWIAKHEGLDMVSLDDKITARAGKPIPEIFRADGEEAFREIESQVLAEALAMTGPVVIDTGGGIVDKEGNRAALKASSTDRCYIRVGTAELVARIKETSSRPMLDGAADLAERVAGISGRRDGLYQEAATYVIEHAPGEDVLGIAQRVLEGLRS